MTMRSMTIALVVALAAVAPFGTVARGQAPKSIRIGYVLALTGPNAPGAGITTLPNYRLWAKDVNAAGGIMLSSIGRRVPVEIVEYDSHSNVDQTIEAVDRLISRDKVDFILAPWGTGVNLVVGPILHRAGYPHLAVTALTDEAPQLAKRWPNSFWFLGTMTGAAQALAGIVAKLRDEGKINNKVVMLSVADQFGIGSARAARRVFKKHKLEVVYDRAYPVDAPGMAAIIADAKQSDADTFVAFSYPPDTMLITEQARALNYNPKIFYTAVGTAFPVYKQRFGSDVEGVMGIGGWNAASPESQAYLKHHRDVTGEEPDRWASPITYASLQMLQQAIERVGRIDRAAAIKELQTGTFQTILGPVKLHDNMYTGNWYVGQWQEGEFYGVAPPTLPGAHPVLFPKPPWHGAR